MFALRQILLPIKSRRMRWARFVAHIEEMSNSYKSLEMTSQGTWAALSSSVASYGPWRVLASLFGSLDLIIGLLGTRDQHVAKTSTDTEQRNI